MLVKETLASGMRVWHARPDTGDPRPAVLLLHERYGPVPYSFDAIEKLAGDGFVACVYDMFHRYQGDRRPIEQAQARVDPTDDEALADLDETIAYLRKLPYVDGDRIGMAGFCLSGRTPLVYAAARDDVSAIAVFHGGIYPRDYEASMPGQQTVAGLIPRLSCPVLGGFGEHDNLVPLENVRRFRGELERHGRSFEIRVFANVPHAWLNHTTDAYRKREADEAWAMMVRFFTEVFDGTWDGQTVARFQADPSIAFDFALA